MQTREDLEHQIKFLIDRNTILDREARARLDRIRYLEGIRHQIVDFCLIVQTVFIMFGIGWWVIM